MSFVGKLLRLEVVATCQNRKLGAMMVVHAENSNDIQEIIFQSST